MSEPTWLPLGIESEDAIASFDALHDGVPDWMSAEFWHWIRQALTIHGRYPDGSGSFPILRTKTATELAQTLQISMPNVRANQMGAADGHRQITTAMGTIKSFPHPLRIADYLLAHESSVEPNELDQLLKRCKSLYEVGERYGRPGLVRRVPLGVKVNAEAVMLNSGQAGARLAQAWEALFGVVPDPSKSYGLAIKAVEDAAVPTICPTNTRATLGTLIRQIQDQGNWLLPMYREPADTSSTQTILSMMKLLWHGQHDRHGGQPSSPGNVSFDEAQVAVSLASSIVQLFAGGLVHRA